MRSTLGIVGLASIFTFSGCTFTGLPAHGGGKRFAIEQELISASARAAAKDLKVDALKGKKCAVYITTIGDQGAGNMGNGSGLNLDYLKTAVTRNNFPGPRGVINFPSQTQTQGTDVKIGSSTWPPSYRSEAFLNPKDGAFLNAVINESLVLKGVVLVTPAQADVYVYISVDVFGTIRSRKSIAVAHKEILKAKTAMQVMGFDKDRKLVLSPTTSSWEAEYVEKYVMWTGPWKGPRKSIRRSENLLVDFRDGN